MFTTSRSFYIGIIRNAVEEFEGRFSGFGTLEAVASHIGADFTAQGYAEGSNRQAVEMVERIALRLEQEQVERFARQAALRVEREAGRIDEETFLFQYYL